MSPTRTPGDAGADLARAALLEHCDEGTVGDHSGMHLDDSGLIIHEFTCTMQGYPNWVWTVVLAHDTDTGTLSVCDAVLLPAEGALVPPAWVPWSSRVQPGDLRPGDLLPSDPQDPRLVPGFEPAKADATDEQDVLDAVWELGLGRERLLSPEGRDSASYRWWRGDTGPSAPDARLAPHPCSTCGFFIGIKGSLGAGFGVCANEISPADGRVVSVAFGCGAHSGIVVEPAAAALPQVTLDENEYDTFSLQLGAGDGDSDSDSDASSQTASTAADATDVIDELDVESADVQDTEGADVLDAAVAGVLAVSDVTDVQDAKGANVQDASDAHDTDGADVLAPLAHDAAQAQVGDGETVPVSGDSGVGLDDDEDGGTATGGDGQVGSGADDAPAADVPQGDGVEQTDSRD